MKLQDWKRISYLRKAKLRSKSVESEIKKNYKREFLDGIDTVFVCP
jgi:hypothetical protein